MMQKLIYEAQLSQTRLLVTGAATPCLPTIPAEGTPQTSCSVMNGYGNINRCTCWQGHCTGL